MRKFLAVIFSLALLVSFASMGSTANACFPDDPGYDPGLC